MDNLTHTLAGMAVAETVVQARSRFGAPLSASWRTTAWVVSAIANNAPDLDILYATGHLGYLEHHRGHTHTLLAVLPLALVALGYAYAKWRWRLTLWNRSDWWWLVALAIFGGVLHISMDSLNNYGVHPFWPFDNRWRYGDTLFIIEPWVWLILTPLLAASLLGRTRKLLLGLIFAVGAGLPFFFGMQPLGITIAALVAALGWWRLAARLPGWPRCVVGLGLAVTMVTGFAVTSQHVKAIVEVDAREHWPDAASIQLVATPLPSNPLCWNVIDARRLPDDLWFVRTGTVTLARKYQPAAVCGAGMSSTPNLPLVPIPATGGEDDFDARIVWRNEFRAPLSELRAMRADRCEVASLLRFSRVPAWRILPDAIQIGDVRYDRGGKAGFAELTLKPSDINCPAWPAPWDPPLEAVL